MKKVFFIIVCSTLFGCSNTIQTDNSEEYPNSKVEMLGIQKLHIDTLEIKIGKKDRLLAKQEQELSEALDAITNLEESLKKSKMETSEALTENFLLLSKIEMLEKEYSKQSKPQSKEAESNNYELASK